MDTVPFRGVSADAFYKGYADERKLIHDYLRDTAKTLDQALLTLSSGAFGVSVLILTQVVKTPHPGTTQFLYLAWVLFGVAILATLVALQLNVQAGERASDDLNALYASRTAPSGNVIASIAVWIGWVGIAGFVFGVAFFAWFCWLNFQN